MEIISYIIGIPIVIVLIIFLSWLFGNTFRNWNESTTYDDSKIQDKGSMTKTMIIGFVILIVVGWIVSNLG